MKYLIGETEDRIVSEIARRLTAGKRTYGAWPKRDTRNLAKEQQEEVFDAMAYAARNLLEIGDRATTDRTALACLSKAVESFLALHRRPKGAQAAEVKEAYHGVLQALAQAKKVLDE